MQPEAVRRVCCRIVRRSARSDVLSPDGIDFRTINVELHGEKPVNVEIGGQVEVVDGGVLKLTEPSKVEGRAQSEATVTLYSPAVWKSVTYPVRKGPMQ